MRKSLHGGSIWIVGLIFLVSTVLIACQGTPEPTELLIAESTPQATEALATALPSPTDTPIPAPTPVPTDPPAPTDVPSTIAPAPTELPATITPTPTETPIPTNTPEPTSTPTPEPTSTPTPEPTNTPTPEPLPSFDGVFVLTVAQPQGKSFTGKTVDFRIGGITAAETSSWTEGGVTRLALTASGNLGRVTPGTPALTASAALPLIRTSGLLARPLMQPAPPQIFVGTATVNGAGVPEGTVVSAWVDGEAVPGAEGAIVPTPDATSGDTGGAAQALAPLGDNLIRVWRFYPPTQSWMFFDPSPELAPYNTITELEAGVLYQVIVEESQNAVLNGRDRALYAALTWIDW